MINTEITTTKGMEQAQKQMEQAKNRMAMEKKKANEERRKFENHHKYMMGGAVHKYFKECFSFEESEINEILEVAFKTTEVQKTISAIKRRAGVQVESSPVEKELIKIERRYDNRGRVLHDGEYQLPDGRYRFRYTSWDGKRKAIYSWRLDKNDKVPQGKKRTDSLREMEKQIHADSFDKIVSNGGNLTVFELVQKYVNTRVGVRISTRRGYQTVLNFLEKEPFGKKRIDLVRKSDAKLWLIQLQQEKGKSYSQIHTIRGLVRPAFKLAMDDDLIRKNPFDFELVNILVNDSVRRDALSREDERKFLKFIQEDRHYKKYYEGIYILFNTGMRISEFCGLTISDIDFKNHSINIELA